MTLIEWLSRSTVFLASRDTSDAFLGRVFFYRFYFVRTKLATQRAQMSYHEGYGVEVDPKKASSRIERRVRVERVMIFEIVEREFAQS